MFVGCDLPSPLIHLANGPILVSAFADVTMGGDDCHEDDDDDDDDDYDDADDDDEDNIPSWVFADVMRGRAERGRSGQS